MQVHDVLFQFTVLLVKMQTDEFKKKLFCN